RHPFQRPRAQGADVEAFPDEFERRGAYAYRIRACFRLDTCGDVRCFPDGVVDVCSAGAHRTDDDQAGMDSNARFDAGSALRLQRMVQLADARRDGDSGQNGSFGVVVVRAGIAEKSDDAVADILVYVAAVAGDAVVADALVGAQHVAQSLGVELSRERRRADNVGKQHRQLTTLAIRWSRRLPAARRRAGDLGRFAAARKRSAAGTAEPGI